MKSIKRHLLNAGRFPLAASAVFGCLITLPLVGSELLRDGAFDGGLAEWVIPPDLTGWTPLRDGGHCDTEAPDWAYRGPVVTQNLNVSPLSGATLALSIDVRSGWSLSPATELAVRIVYVDGPGLFHTVTALTVDAAQVSESWGTLSGSVTVPADAERLVSLSVHKLGGQTVWFDNLSLTGDGLSAGALPELATVRPYLATYGETIVLSGTGFGETAGAVLVDGAGGAVSINSWSDTRIEMAAIFPAASGRVVVQTAQGVRSSQARGLEITSPHFWIQLAGRPRLQAIAGQTVDVALYLYFENGYMPLGTVAFSCPELPDAAVFSPAGLSDAGGARMRLDTTGLATGEHALSIAASFDGGPAQTAQFTLVVHALDRIELFFYDSLSQRVPVDDTINLANQSVTDVYCDLYDAADNLLDYDLNDLQWQTSNPLVLDLHRSFWVSGPTLLPQASGACVLTATGPGGFSRTFNVNVSVPAWPRVSDLHFSSNPVTNDGVQTHMLHISADDGNPETYDWVSGWGLTGDLSLAEQESNFSGAYATVEFVVEAGQTPGRFLFSASANQTASRGAVLEVVNHPSRAQVGGIITLMDQTDTFHMSGLLELHDAVTGLKVMEKLVFSYFGSTYTAAFLEPGSYKLRFTPDSWTTVYEPRWHPDALDMSDAAIVTLAAGDSLTDVHFYFPVAPRQPASQPEIAAVSDGSFSLSIVTEQGALYVVEASDSMAEDSWTALLEFVGDGALKHVEDDLPAAGGQRFYRIRKL